MNCPSCGLDNAGNGAECPLCGAPLRAAVPAGCPRCATPAEAGDTYCRRCGTDLGAAAPPADRYSTTPVSKSANARTSGDADAPPNPYATSASAIGAYPRRRSDRGVIALAAVVLAVLVLAVAFLLGAFGRGEQPPPVTSGATAATQTSSADHPTPENLPTQNSPTQHSPDLAGSPATAAPTTSTDPAASTPVQRPSRPMYKEITSVTGHFPNAGTLTDTTSAEFLRAVANQYALSGASGASVTIQAYSPVRKQLYDMDCVDQGDDTVICTGGRNAVILLWGAQPG